MSKYVIVLAPNGRRQTVHYTPDTSILQILEDVCQKQGFQPTDYDLKHHNHILDLTTTIRFSNLPNKATLEMVEAERERQETNITIGLQLEDGERRTADFPPNTSLFDLVTSLAPGEFSSLQSPSILYMRQEITGEPALRGKTLRQLGLISGRAILRLLNKAEESRQANVSAVYRRPFSEKTISLEPNFEKPNDQTATNIEEANTPGPSNMQKNTNYTEFDPIKRMRNIKNEQKKENNISVGKNENDNITLPEGNMEPSETKMEIDPPEQSGTRVVSSNTSIDSQQNLERRLKIEEEVTFLGAQKAISFMQPEHLEDEIEDLPDDFYDLTIEEVRKIYHELQQSRIDLENTPLMTSTKRDDLTKQTSQQKLNEYKNAVVRVQFPDRIILQGVFSPSDTIEDVCNFIKSHLQNPDKPFHIFTTPLKESLDPKMTLLDAKCVPCVLMHFKWLHDDDRKPCLKQEVYLKRSTSEAAGLLASKYRAPSRKKFESAHCNTSQKSKPSTSTSNKIPKWFK